MRFKYALMATTTALALTAGGFAQAQQGTTAPRTTVPPAQAPSSSSLGAGALHEIKDDKAKVSALDVSAKDLGDMAIYGSDGKKIGDINKILGDSSNSIKAVTVDAGGFLGMGAREIVFPVDKLQKGKEKNQLQTTMTKADIEKLDAWEDSNRRDAPPARTGTSPAAPDTAPRTAPSK